MNFTTQIIGVNKLRAKDGTDLFQNIVFITYDDGRTLSANVYSKNKFDIGECHLSFIPYVKDGKLFSRISIIQ